MRRLLPLALVLTATSLFLVGEAQSAGAPIDIVAVLDGVGEAVERYFARAQSLICTETVDLVSMDANMLFDQTPTRHLTYELRLAWEPSVDGGVPEATVQRQLMKVGNRAPGPKDKPGCTDPREVSPEPLEFLLPGKQRESVFTVAGSTKVNGRLAAMLDYRAREVGPITPTMTSEDCWSIDMPGRQRGRVWIDLETNEVLRIDERLAGIFDVTLPATRSRRQRETLTIERLDSSTTYRHVTFADPDETVMLPRSVETVQIVRNSGSPRLRKRQVFSNYRRFITGGRIVE